MGSKQNAEKSRQLGVSHGSAAVKLKKMLLFSFAQRLKLDRCYQCGRLIEDIDNFTVDHKVPWLHSEDPANCSLTWTTSLSHTPNATMVQLERSR